jgi:hypothetical protein
MFFTYADEEVVRQDGHFLAAKGLIVEITSWSSCAGTTSLVVALRSPNSAASWFRNPSC